jgi:hypothetical protein
MNRFPVDFTHFLWISLVSSLISLISPVFLLIPPVFLLISPVFLLTSPVYVSREKNIKHRTEGTHGVPLTIGSHLINSRLSAPLFTCFLLPLCVLLFLLLPLCVFIVCVFYFSYFFKQLFLKTIKLSRKNLRLIRKKNIFSNRK